MTFFFFLKILIVLLFLGLFWWRANWVWGIGLLTVAAAVFIDTFLAIFGREELLTQMGFLYYVLAGLIVGGMAIWLWGMVQPLLGLTPPVVPAAVSPAAPLNQRAASMSNTPSEHDRQLLFNQIWQNLSADDVLDLLFDLNIAENEVIAPGYNMTTIIHNTMDLAQTRNQMSDLALGVERILTPVPPDHLPRLEKLSVDTPPTVLRRYILSFYFLDQIEKLAEQLEIDWELLGLGSKQNKVRHLLLHLRRRNRLAEFIDLLKANPPAGHKPVKTAD